MFAREPVVRFTGEPIPIVLEIDPYLQDETADGLLPYAGQLIARTIYEIAAPSGLFLEVLPPGESAGPNEERLVLRLQGAVRSFSIEQSYRWFLYYSPLIALVFQPIPGPGLIFLTLVFSNAPLMSEDMLSDVDLWLIEPESCEEVGRHRIHFEETVNYGLYDLDGVNEGYYYAPERVLGLLGNRLVNELGWNRWQYYRYADAQPPGDGPPQDRN
jgi:hypothetical protein